MEEQASAMGITPAELRELIADDYDARALLFAPASPPSARGAEPASSAPPAAPSTPRTNRGGKRRMIQGRSHHPRSEREAEAFIQRRMDDGTYRTEMCPSGSSCPRLRGRSCTFAHDESELIPRHPRCAHQRVFQLLPSVLMLHALTFVCVWQVQDKGLPSMARLWTMHVRISMPLSAWRRRHRARQGSQRTYLRRARGDAARCKGAPRLR